MHIECGCTSFVTKLALQVEVHIGVGTVGTRGRQQDAWYRYGGYGGRKTTVVVVEYAIAKTAVCKKGCHIDCRSSQLHAAKIDERRERAKLFIVAAAAAAAAPLSLSSVSHFHARQRRRQFVY